MRLSQIAVKKPVTISMIFTGILIFGLLAFSALKLDILPEAEYPSLTVVTVLPGASSEDVEQQVTKLLEKQLAGVPKIKSLKSVSKENVSFIMLEFNFGTVIGDATNDVRDRIGPVKKILPSYAYDPLILKVDSSMVPVMMYGVSAKESAPGLAKIIDDRIEGRLKQVDGIGGLITLAAPKREIEIIVDPIKLRSSGISVAMIAKLLETQNISVPGGSIKTGGMDLSVRVPAEFESVDEIGEIQIPARDGSMVKLSSLAEIRDKLKDQDLSVRAEGKTMAVIMTQKQSGANTLEVAQNIKAAMEEIRKNVPADVVIEELNDASEVINLSISNLGTTAAYAMIFVILVILFFLREWRGSLIITLTIPFSLIIGLIFMYVCGYTINIFSLMALSITLGMVVDNTVVVFENITRHIEEGARPAEAAIFGAGEMTSAISASTLTTIAVFIPLAFVSGIVGLLFKQLAFVASITIAASLLVSLSLAPMLSSVLMKRKIKEKKHGFLYNLSEKLFVFVENLYKSLLGLNIRFRWFVVIAVAAVFFFTVKAGLSTGTDYIPEFDMGDIVATAELESSVDAEQSEAVARKIEEIVKRNVDEKDIRTYYTITGQTDNGLLSMFGFSEGKNIATIMAKIVNRNQRSYHIKTVAAKIRKEVEEIPEVVSFNMTAGSLLQSAMLGSSKPIEIKIKGNDLKKLAETGDKLQKVLEEQPYLQDVESTVDRGKPEVTVKFDRVKLARLGINAGMAALAVRESLYGADSGNYKQDNDEYDIVIRYDKE
ncbi:efflux RND transporter permease subunit, partial [bacterium]|nr:efflux RND transporter permease subunit [bacterium]